MPRRREAESVTLYNSPWVSGTKAAAYFGPVHAETFIETAEGELVIAWDKAIEECTQIVIATAEQLGANALVGVEWNIDLWRKWKGLDGIWCGVTATAARLEPLS